MNVNKKNSNTLIQDTDLSEPKEFIFTNKNVNCVFKIIGDKLFVKTKTSDPFKKVTEIKSGNTVQTIPNSYENLFRIIWPNPNKDVNITIKYIDQLVTDEEKKGNVIEFYKTNSKTDCFLKQVTINSNNKYIECNNFSENDNRTNTTIKFAEMFKLYKILLSMIFAFAFSDIVANKMTSLW